MFVYEWDGVECLFVVVVAMCDLVVSVAGLVLGTFLGSDFLAGSGRGFSCSTRLVFFFFLSRCPLFSSSLGFVSSANSRGFPSSRDSGACWSRQLGAFLPVRSPRRYTVPTCICPPCGERRGHYARIWQIPNSGRLWTYPCR
jgi:hypothetical protein